MNKRNCTMEKKKAFSLIELIISLIVIALITAAFTPVISKKIKSGELTVGSIGGGGGNIGLEFECSDERYKSGCCSICTGNDNSSTCLICDSKCANCEKNEYLDTQECACVNCASPSAVDDENCTGSCKRKWPSGTYVCTKCSRAFYINDDGKCDPCPNGKICDGKDYYNTCNEMTEGCVACDNENGCVQCQEDQYIEDGKCKDCPNDPGFRCDGVNKIPIPAVCDSFNNDDILQKEGNQCIECTAQKCTKCENGYYLRNNKCTRCPSGKTCDGYRYMNCSERWTRCNQCDARTCLGCPQGYIWRSLTDSCETSEYDTYSDGAGFMWTIRNAGDDRGPAIPEDGSVAICYAGQTCSYGDTHPTCWKANVSANGTIQTNGTTGANASSLDSYSGATRTVCNWYAASIICRENDGMRLPTTDELRLHSLISNKSYGVCSSSAATNGARCSNQSDNCKKAGSNQTWGSATGECSPYVVWSAADGSYTNPTWGGAYYGFSANGNSWEVFTASGAPKFAGSVRCVKRCDETWPYCAKCNITQCERCMDGYHLDSNGQSCIKDVYEVKTYSPGDGFTWTTRNPGDPGGPEIPNSVKTRTTLSSAGSGGGTLPTCWYGQNTGGGGTVVDGYSGNSRTVCNWYAAIQICEANGMRLPTTEELRLHNLLSNQKYGVCSNGTLGLNYAQCAQTSNCYGAGSNQTWGSATGECSPYIVWSAADSSYTNPQWGGVYYGFQSDGSGNWQAFNPSGPQKFAGSVRCVKRCDDTWPYCTKCNLTECEECQDGYIISGGKCVRDSQEVKTYSPGDSFVWTTRNPGDPGGPYIPNGIALRATNSTAVSGGGVMPTCWYGDNTGSGNSIVDEYSGNSRTVCNWYAAIQICNYNSMRLPTTEELRLHNLLSNQKYGVCSNGTSGVDYAKCALTNNCYGAGSNQTWGSATNECNPYIVFSAGDKSYTNPTWGGVYYGFQSNGSGNWEVFNPSGPQKFAGSVRCVKRCDDTWPFCTKCNYSKCEECSTGYHADESSGRCNRDNMTVLTTKDGNNLTWTRRNPGDPGGPIIPNGIALRATNSTAISGGGQMPTCWFGSNTGSGNSVVDDYSGNSRVLCNWYAAAQICTANGMRLPTTLELKNNNLLNNISYGVCSNSTSGVKYAQCAQTSNCYGAGSNQTWGSATNECNPYVVFSAGDKSYTNPTWGGVYYGLQSNGSGNWDIFTASGAQYFAASVRCVKDPT